MSLPWFRLYSEFLSDPLIRLLSFEDQRHFIAALCMKCSGVTDKRYATVTVRKNVISSLIGLSSEAGAGGSSALDLANERLRALGLIDEEWHPTNWDKRQFQSDHVDRTAAERMRRYRSKRNVTDVTTVVTATDTDTDTDIRKAKKKAVAVAPVIQGLDPESWTRWEEYRRKSGKPIKPASLEAAQKKLASFGSSQAIVVEESIANGYQGLFPPKGNGTTRTHAEQGWS